ncbi:hypothetical protein Tco_0327602, partial [Tanacetum coccineum]
GVGVGCSTNLLLKAQRWTSLELTEQKNETPDRESGPRGAPASTFEEVPTWKEVRELELESRGHQELQLYLSKVSSSTDRTAHVIQGKNWNLPVLIGQIEHLL